MQNYQPYTVRQVIGLCFGVLAFCIILAVPTNSSLGIDGQRTAAVAALMAIWWMTEAIPISATALIPLGIFPVLKIQTAAETAASYGDRNIFLFMGGFFIAAAMQKWNLHRRIALHILRIIGTAPRQLLFGTMLATALLSMWISNTATTIMMLPIGMAMILSIIDLGQIPDEYCAKFKVAIMLAIAYSASIGGIGTLVGTPPNIVFTGIVSTLFPDAPEFSFSRWLIVGLPVVICFLPIVWAVFTFILFKIPKLPENKNRELLNEQINKLGTMVKGERIVLWVFIFTAFGWIFRKEMHIGALTIPGWSELLGISEYVHDSTVAIFSALLLFSIPLSLKQKKFPLDWKEAKQIPWGILILFGGGIALAGGFQDSGLSHWIGERLRFVQFLHPFLIILITCAVITFLTELTSNIATATIFLPIVGSIAISAHMHPYVLMLPATIAASCAFMLPVGTPPNAIVFSSGYVSMTDMVRAGFWLNIIGIMLVSCITYFLIMPLLNISPYALPSWLM